MTKEQYKTWKYHDDGRPWLVWEALKPFTITLPIYQVGSTPYGGFSKSGKSEDFWTFVLQPHGTEIRQFSVGVGDLVSPMTTEAIPYFNNFVNDGCLGVIQG